MSGTAKKLLAGVAIMLAVAAGVYCYRSCGESLHNDGDGADAAGVQLEQAGAAQRTITSGLADAERAAGEIAGEIDNAARTVDRLETSQRNAGELISDCQQILRNIRERAEADAK